jgi:phosphoserine phosphatase RsbU/P
LLVRSSMARVTDPGECLEEVNDQLCIQGFMGQFVTMLLMVIDTDNKVVEVAAAGHPAPLVGEGGEFHPMALEPQLVLGIDRGVSYKTQRIHLTANAAILLYTDGVTDVQSKKGERYEAEGLQKSLYGKFSTAQSILDTVVQAIDMFRNGQELPDDLTLVAVQLQAKAAPLLAEPATAV